MGEDLNLVWDSKTAKGDILDLATLHSYIHELWSKHKEASELTYKGKGHGGQGQNGQSVPKSKKRKTKSKTSDKDKEKDPVNVVTRQVAGGGQTKSSYCFCCGNGDNF